MFQCSLFLLPKSIEQFQDFKKYIVSIHVVPRLVSCKCKSKTNHNYFMVSLHKNPLIHIGYSCLQSSHQDCIISMMCSSAAWNSKCGKASTCVDFYSVADIRLKV
jgi:hypothetical protein